MRVTLKLLLWFLVCVVLGLGLNAVLAVRAELSRYEATLSERHEVMGKVLRAAFVEVVRRDGVPRAVSVLESSDQGVRQVNLRWVHLTKDAPDAYRPAVTVERLAALRVDDDAHIHDGGHLRSYVLVQLEGLPDSAIELSEELDAENVVRRTVAHEARAVVLIALGIAVVAFLAGAVVVARPMQALVEHARRIGGGDLSAAVVPASRDEIADLGTEMNAMCAELRSARAATLKALDELRHADRLTTVGKLASGLAHELGTPLNVVALRAKSIARSPSVDAQVREAASAIAEQATKMTELVRRLLDFARRKPPKAGRVDVGVVVGRALRLLEPLATKTSVTMKADVDGCPTVTGDAGQLEQVVTNLVMNAIQAMPGGGAVRIEATRAEGPVPGGDPDAKSHACIVVQDTGPGIPPDVLPHVFEPFFTTKDVGAGTGLGLSVCYGIVVDHRGAIEARSSEDGGASFVVRLPEALS
jgi:signal transduction histidine kinase